MEDMYEEPEEPEVVRTPAWEGWQSSSVPCMFQG